MNIAFIPVRGGSKNIPRKNIRLLAGKPLVCYVIEAALEVQQIDKVVVATDAEYIAQKIVEYYGVNPRVEIYNRDPVNATDTSSTESVMIEYAQKHIFDYMVLIQATSPLLSPQDLNGAMAKFFQVNAGSLLSVVRQKRFVWKMNENDFVSPQNYDFKQRPRRQNFDGFLVENGAFYIISKQNLLESQCRLADPVAIWEMPDESYVELDEPHDWQYVEQLLKHKHKTPVSFSNLNSIKLFLTDVDGVLTDAGMYYSEVGDELKKFNTRDGKGFELLRTMGIKTGIITAENTRIVERRATKLKVDFLFQGVQNKLEVLHELLNKTGFKPEEVAYIGDDLNDVEIIRSVGLSACPADAVGEVKRNVHYVLNAKGGEGAVREFIEIICNTFE